MSNAHGGPEESRLSKDIPKRLLGRTALEVTILGVGGYHMAKPGEAAGIKIIRRAIDGGVNFLDNAWCYHGGKSEEIMGRALRDGYREKVILMTKNHGRDYDTFNSQLDDSLRRLQTDFIDVLQFHEIIHEGEPGRIFDEGAIDAAIEARNDNRIGHIGFTGHRWPRLLEEMLSKDFEWETVQMPVNLLDHHYRSVQKRVMATLCERNIGVIGMKSQAGGGLLRLGKTQPEDNIRFSLSMPISTLVSGMDSVEVLEENLRIARAFEPLTDGEIDSLLDATEPASRDGAYEHYKD